MQESADLRAGIHYLPSDLNDAGRGVVAIASMAGNAVVNVPQRLASKYRLKSGRQRPDRSSVANVTVAVSCLSGDESGLFRCTELLLDEGHFGVTDQFAAGADKWRQPRVPLAFVLGTDPSPTSAASEADVTGLASFEHPLVWWADTHEIDVRPPYQQRSIVCPDGGTRHGA